MDPSFSVSTDPTPQFAPFTSFAAIFGASPSAAGNHHVPQAQSARELAPTPPPTHPVYNHPPYPDMICAAIAALNEPDGSSKQAISRYIGRVFSGLPPAHGALLTHHLKTLKNSGVLVLIKKSYKLASAPPLPSANPADVPPAAPTVESPRPNFVNTSNQPPSDITAGVSATPKRGRGRPPKPKPETLAGVQLNPAEPSSVSQPHGQNGTAMNSGSFGLTASGSAEESEVVKRSRGRPRKDVSQPQVAPLSTPEAAPSSGIVKRRGRPPGRRGPGRPKKIKSVYPYATNSPRGRGRPRKTDYVSAETPVVAAVDDGEMIATVPSSGKRRGRPPKIGGVISQPLKPLRRSERSVGRPRKNANLELAVAHVPQATAAYEEVRRKLQSFQEKVSQVVDVLRAEVGSENHNVMSAINDLEGLLAMDINESTQTQSEAEAQDAAELRSETETIDALF